MNRQKSSESIRNSVSGDIAQPLFEADLKSILTLCEVATRVCRMEEEEGEQEVHFKKTQQRRKGGKEALEEEDVSTITAQTAWRRLTTGEESASW